MASRTVCRFWSQGNCKFGDSCRFDHPRGAAPRQDNNRFAPLNDNRNYGGNGSRNYSSRDPPRQRQSHTDPEIDQSLLRKELTNEKPIWILSAYSPIANAPKQLFGGPERELSPEEVRLRHYELAAQGQTQVAVQEAEALYAKAQSQIDNVLQDVPGAVRYLQNGYKEHPNRTDICEACTKNGAYSIDAANVVNSQGANAFNQSMQANTGSTFGQASGISLPGQGTAVKPAFGVSSLQQPASTSGFGLPSTLGATKPSGLFGQPSSLGNAQPAFGMPSITGANTNPFSQGGNASRQLSSPFSQQPSFTTNPFKQSNGTSTISPADASMTMSPTPTSSAFGLQPTGGFGAPSGGLSTGFGQGRSGQQNTSFGQATGGFGGSLLSNNVSNPSGSFGQASMTNNGVGASTSTFGRGNANSTATGAGGKISNWEGRQVRYFSDEHAKEGDKEQYPCYQEDNGYWQRIWFPEDLVWHKAEAFPSDLQYDAECEDRYKIAKQDGRFKDGIIPLLPPKREWTSWNL